MLISGIVNPKMLKSGMIKLELAPLFIPENKMKVTDYMELSTPSIQRLDFVLEAENKRKKLNFPPL